MNRVEQRLSPLVGQYVWGVDWDSQLSLSMNFGAPSLRILEPFPSRPFLRRVRPRGEWWLWVYFSFWEISFDGALAARGGTAKVRSPFKKIVSATSRLDGQIVTAVRVRPKSGRLTMRFDLGGRLDVWRIDRRSKEDAWLVYPEAGGLILTVRSDGRFSEARSPEEGAWMPIADDTELDAPPDSPQNGSRSKAP